MTIKPAQRLKSVLVPSKEQAALKFSDLTPSQKVVYAAVKMANRTSLSVVSLNETQMVCLVRKGRNLIITGRSMIVLREEKVYIEIAIDHIGTTVTFTSTSI